MVIRIYNIFTAVNPEFNVNRLKHLQ